MLSHIYDIRLTFKLLKLIFSRIGKETKTMKTYSLFLASVSEIPGKILSDVQAFDFLTGSTRFS